MRVFVFFEFQFVFRICVLGVTLIKPEQGCAVRVPFISFLVTWFVVSIPKQTSWFDYNMENSWVGWPSKIRIQFSKPHKHADAFRFPQLPSRACIDLKFWVIRVHWFPQLLEPGSPSLHPVLQGLDLHREVPMCTSQKITPEPKTSDGSSHTKLSKLGLQSIASQQQIQTKLSPL